MPWRTRSAQSGAVIDGVRLVWRVHREQPWFTADRWKGVSIEVGTIDGSRRKLLLEYPVIREPKKGWTRPDLPARPRIHRAKVESYVRLAMAAGWDPLSRDKPFVYQLNELPG